MTTQEIRSKIETIVDESRLSTLKELNAIKHIGVDSDRNIVILIITIGVLGGQEEKNLRRNLAKVIKLDLNFRGVKIQFEEEKNIISPKTKFIIIASGKGGVGKSTITANLAYALMRQGKKVGIVDADIYGSSLPDIMEMPMATPHMDNNQFIIPFKKQSIEMVSTAFFSETNKPVLWRGAQLKTMIHNYFFKVRWSKDIDYVLVDSPPGTGDVMFDLKAIIPSAEILLVTTPNHSAAQCAIKAGNGYREIHHRMIGIVENMAYYMNPQTNQKEYIFGKGGAEEVSKVLDLEILASIPINPPKDHFAIFKATEETGLLFDDLATLLIIRE